MENNTAQPYFKEYPRDYHKDPKVGEQIVQLLLQVGLDPTSLKGELTGQIMATALKMSSGNEMDMGQIKLINRCFKEMRYAYRIFNEHRNTQCVSIFGSARTPQDHPDYIVAREFSKAMTESGWGCMTGAADGIMRAGLEGADKKSSFGLSIRLPFESGEPSLSKDDPKLISFRYFFTRKLMFLSHSDAIAVLPGGVGTQDELFEALTLMQTGRSNIVPLVLLEGGGSNYWGTWEHYLQNCLLARGLISAEDQNFYYRSPTVAEAVSHILRFYRRYHSSRTVKDFFVIRMKSPLLPPQIEALNDEFHPLFSQGSLIQTSPLPEEEDFLNLPRLIFAHNRKHYGLLRGLIDKINEFDSP